MSDYGYKIGPDGSLSKSAAGALHDMSRKQMAIDLGSVSKGERTEQLPLPNTKPAGIMHKDGVNWVPKKSAKDAERRAKEEKVRTRLKREGA
jgi:hypothetical protein